MHTLSDYNFNGVYARSVKRALEEGSTVTIGTGPNGDRTTRELQHVSIAVSRPWEHLVTAHGRPVNVAFALVEVIWILAGRNDVAFLAPWNSNISNFSDDGVTFNAAYGWRMRHGFGVDQLQDIFRLLTEDPASRQAVLQTWDPRWDRSYEPNGPWDMKKRVTKDRACNTQSQLMVRDEKLQWMQLQRSNDLIWGTPYNYMQFSHIQRFMAGLLGVGMGEYMHVINSLHIYDDFIEEAEQIRHFDLYAEWERPLPEWGEVDFETIDLLAEVVNDIQAGRKLGYTFTSDYWDSAVVVLQAHKHYQDGEDDLALDTLISADSVYGPAQARFFWSFRWSKWDSPNARQLMRSRMEAAWGENIASWVANQP